MEFRALVYVPDKLIAAVCFPNFEVENRFPHCTLLTSEGWAPVLSNTLLETTCDRGKCFYEAYEAARKGIRPAPDAGVLVEKSVRINNKGNQECVFVLLRQPVKFVTEAQKFY